MSRTYKTQKAYLAHHTDIDDYYEWRDTFRDAGHRYGDQRKMRAKLKVSERRIERKKNNREANKIIKELGSE